MTDFRDGLQIRSQWILYPNRGQWPRYGGLGAYRPHTTQPPPSLASSTAWQIWAGLEQNTTVATATLSIGGQSEAIGPALGVANAVLSIGGQAETLAIAGTAAQPATSQDAGAAGRPRRIRYAIEVDGQTFDFASLAAALRFLAKAKEEATALAKRVADAAARKSAKAEPVKIKRPRIVAKVPEIAAAVQDTRKLIEEAYARAERDAEIMMHFEIAARKEDEEAVEILLM